MKDDSFSSFMLKTPSFITQVLKDDKDAQENTFNHMLNFGSQIKRRSGRISIGSYLDGNVIKDQDLLINPNPLDTITG